MDNDKNPCKPTTQDIQKEKRVKCNDISNVIYGMGFIGAAIYFIQHAPTFWAGVFGVFKAVLWPAVLVYKLLELLKM